MNTLKEYIEEKEELNETVGEIAATTVIGLPTIGLLTAWGTSLILYGFSKGSRRVYNIFKKATENFAFIKRDAFETYFNGQKSNPVVKQEIVKATEKKKEYFDVLEKVYDAIDEENYTSLKNEYNALPSNFRNMSAIKQVVINEVTKKIGEPAINKPSPGNKTYKIIRDVLGLKEAKAAATAVMYSMSKAASAIDEK